MVRPVRVYLDACCINRLFDDQAQDRIHLEAVAVLLILGHVGDGAWEWIGSEALDFEIAQMPEVARQASVGVAVEHVCRRVQVTQRESARARELVGLGLQTLDALHVACAEAARADVMFTTHT